MKIVLKYAANLQEEIHQTIQRFPVNLSHGFKTVLIRTPLKDCS